MHERIVPSPWLNELQRHREPVALGESTQCDVAVVGAGISGVTTAMQLLACTQYRVVLLEAHELGSGATGYNAGQALAEHELPFPQIVRRHGYEKAKAAMEDVTRGYRMLGMLLRSPECRVWYAQTYSYEGLHDKEQVKASLREILMERRAGLHNHHVVVADSWKEDDIYSQFGGLYRTVDSTWLKSMLRTHEDYLAAVLTPATLLNPAQLCSDLIAYLEKTYPHRFALYEHTPVCHVEVDRFGRCSVLTDSVGVGAKNIVFCTNGYQNFSLHDVRYPDLQGHMFRQVQGVVGYMATVTDSAAEPWAAAYLQAGDPYHDDGDIPYIYATGRPQGCDGSAIHIGGPVRNLANDEVYNQSREVVPEEARVAMQDYACRRLRRVSEDPVKLEMLRYGLMGYRQAAQMREVGQYCEGPIFVNRACCGIGLAASLAAAERVTDMILGRRFAPSVFDPEAL